MNAQLKRGKSAIYSSILKHGHSSFSLEILEYCEPDNVVTREQHYLDLLKPEYNILKIAGSLKGFRHSEATKELMKIARKDRIISEETKLKLAEGSPKAQSAPGELISIQERFLRLHLLEKLQSLLVFIIVMLRNL
jgi:group I intron endonuclease